MIILPFRHYIFFCAAGLVFDLSRHGPTASTLGFVNVAKSESSLLSHRPMMKHDIFLPVKSAPRITSMRHFNFWRRRISPARFHRHAGAASAGARPARRAPAPRRWLELMYEATAPFPRRRFRLGATRRLQYFRRPRRSRRWSCFCDIT